MFLRTFAILCMLQIAAGARADYEEDTLEAGALDKEARSHQLRLLKCAEDQLPTAADNLFCAAFEGDGDACLRSGCRSLDRLAPSGRLSCEGQCNDGSAAEELDGLSVPEAVKRAVQRAQGMAKAAGSAAATKVETARRAEQEAMARKTEARKVAAAAERSLEQAEIQEKQAQTAQDQMQAAMAEAMQADAEMNQRTQEHNAAVAVKAEKLNLMKQALKAKQDKEADWKMQDMIHKQELDAMNELVPKLQARLEAEKRKAQELFANLEQQIAQAEARKVQAGKKRGEIKNIKDTEGKQLSTEYKAIFDQYKAEKDNVERLDEVAKNSEVASERASGSARSAVAEYWQKVASFRTASDQKMQAKEASDSAEAAALEAEFRYGAESQVMAQALQDQADAVALKAQVAAVYKYAAEFYGKLKEVREPEGGNEMMKAVKLATDPAMKPCLSSYNVVITAANSLATSNAEPIIAELKTGLNQINDDRFTRFRSWCGENGKEDIAHWIWGANGLTKKELEL